MKATVDVVVDSAEEFQVFWIANPLVAFRPCCKPMFQEPAEFRPWLERFRGVAL